MVSLLLPHTDSNRLQRYDFFLEATRVGMIFYVGQLVELMVESIRNFSNPTTSVPSLYMSRAW